MEHHDLIRPARRIRYPAPVQLLLSWSEGRQRVGRLSTL
jgi:hypothetical protein